MPDYTEELYKKDLHDPDNHAVITHLEPDILECEVKWALESITANKASGHDGPAILLLGIQPKELKTCPHKNVHMDVYSSLIHKCPKLEGTQLSFNR